jgi:glycosyltransferase involved in cell wall biosynthesis
MSRVSVVIPSYNHEKYIGECIQSILDQTYQDFEIVITDDGSTDGTVSVIREFDDSRIHLYTHAENKGACTAINNCIRKASGEYIAVLSSDDAWQPTKLEKQVQYLDSYPEIGAVFTKVIFVNETGNLIGPEDYRDFYIFEKENRSRYEWLNYFFSSGNCLCHPSVLIRRKCYDDIGLYDERMATLPDMDMWVRLCIICDIYILDEKLVRLRIMADKSSASADTLPTNIRVRFEYMQILNHYLEIKDRKTFLKIFPEVEKYGAVGKKYIPYFLSRLALDIDERTWYLWGLQTLFNFLEQDDIAISLQKKYGFHYRDFYSLTAKRDIFNFEAVTTLREKASQINRLNAQINRLNAQINRLNAQIQQIQHSIPMQLVYRYQKVIERLLRSGTRRRRYYELVLSSARVVLNEGWRALWWRFRNYRGVSDNRPPVARAEKRRTGKAVKAKQRLVTFRPPCNRFALYVSSLGNYFFSELAALLSAGLKELGFEVDWRDENAGFAQDADWHIVAAPHEFFYLGAGGLLRDKELPPNLVMVNFEQPSTSWFSLAQKCFSKAHAIWDINYEVAQLIADSGFACEHLPFGYVPEFFKEVTKLPEHYGTCFLEDSVRSGCYLDEPLLNRPVDLLFIGSLTERRGEFFAMAAPTLANYSCYLHFSDPSFPLIRGENTPMNTATVAGLGQRTKIILNIHQGKDKYFEWQRIVTHGIWQKALVISEPCSPGPPFQPGIDFVEAPLDEIPAKIEYYLSSAQGQEEAQAIATQGFQTLTEKCRLADILRSLILHLYIPAHRTKFWEIRGSRRSIAEKNVMGVSHGQH